MLFPKIYLPSHTSTRELFEVLLKIVDYPFISRGEIEFPEMINLGLVSKSVVEGPRVIEENFYGKTSNPPGTTRKSFNQDLPSSESNYWTMTPAALPENEKDIKISLYQSSYGEDVTVYAIRVKDQSGQYHQMRYDTDYASDEHELECGNKVLSPSNSAFGLAMGKKLVDFYGGKMLFLEMQQEKSDAWYVNLDAIYTPQKFTVKDRDFHFSNCLYNLKPICIEDIKEMQTKDVYEDNQDFINFLNSKELAEKIDKNLPLKEKSKLSKI